MALPTAGELCHQLSWPNALVLKKMSHHPREMTERLKEDLAEFHPDHFEDKKEKYRCAAFF